MKEKASIGTGMLDWSKKLKKTDSSFSSEFNEPREIGWKNLETLDLPRYRRISLPLGEFLKQPEMYLKKLGSERFFAYLFPSDGKGRVTREKDLDKKAVLEFISSSIPEQNISRYKINVAEWYKNEYGGNIQIGDEGKIEVEFRKGDQGPISAGTATPGYTAESDPFTGTFHYSFEDTRLREYVQKLMASIPRDEKKYMPGFYEFQLVRKNAKDELLRPYFVDCRTSKGYRK